MRAANRAADEKKKKVKDDKKVRQRAKERAKLDQGKPHQGSDNEEEDEGDSSPVKWDKLSGVDMDLSSP